MEQSPEIPLTEITLSAGTVEYGDTGGAGSTLVLLHGLLMDESLWHGVVAELARDHRCVLPVLPLGAHRRPMPDADLSLPGVARLLGELLERLDLRDVTLIGNDTGGAIVQLLMADPSPRVARVVLASCDAFENFPPGLTGRTLVRSGRLAPRLFGMFMQQLRLRPMRRLPLSFGWLTRHGDATVRGWLRPILTDREIRYDAVRVLRAIAADRMLLLRTAQRLPSFDRPALVLWARGDRVMPPAHGRKLAELLPDARFVEVDDSYTLIPLDRPAAFAEQVRAFVAAAPMTDSSTSRSVGEPGRTSRS